MLDLALKGGSPGLASALYKFKVVVVGDTAVGKTSLIRRYVTGRFEESLLPTVGADFYVKDVKVGGDVVRLVIWDLAGQERFGSIRTAFYRGAKGALVVFDLSRIRTFDHVEGWVKEVKDHCGEIPLVLVGNKLDLKREVKKEEAEEKAKKIGAAHYLEVCAKTGENVDEMFRKLASLILKTIIHG